MPRTAGSPDQTRRLLWLSGAIREGDADLGSGRARASTLLAHYQTEFGMERKTLGRDLQRLREEWGARLSYDESLRVWILRGELRPPECCRPRVPERTSVATVRTIARLMTEATHVGNLLGLLDDLLPVLQERGAPLEQVTVVAPPRMRIADQALLERWSRLHEAIAQRRRVEFHYRSAGSGRARWFRLEPLQLLWVSGGWYLAAAMPGSSAVFQYALSRMEDVPAILRGRFLRPDADRAARLAELCSHAEGVYRSGPVLQAVLRIESSLAPLMRDRVFDPDPASSIWTEEADGSWTLRQSVFGSSEGLKDAARRILSYGPAAKVLQPAKLAETVRALAQEIAERYRKEDA